MSTHVMPGKINSKRGFTLIELLVVISIIALLASIIFSAVTAARSKARDAERISDMRQLSNAINLYFSDKGSLPRNQTGWCTTVSNATNGWGPAFQADLVPTYIGKVSLDPTKANQVGDYFYFNQGNTTNNFSVCAMLENSSNGSYDYSACANGRVYNYCVSQ